MLRPSMLAQLVEGRLRVPSVRRTVHVTEREMDSYLHSEIARSNNLDRRAILTRQ